MRRFGPPPTPRVPEAEPDVLAAALAAGAPLVDVREPDEYEAAHVPGARLIPLGALAARANEVPRDRTVYVICASGGRSAAAVHALNGAGYDAVNVAGGTLRWLEEGREYRTGLEP